MISTYPMSYCPNMFFGYSKHFSYFLFRSFRIPFHYIFNIVNLQISYFAKRMIFPVRLSAFFFHIVHIILSSSYGKMIWIDTLSVVTRVQNMKTVWYFSFIKGVRESMCGMSYKIRSSTIPKFPISGRTDRCSPDPTTIFFFGKFTLKPFLYGFKFSETHFTAWFWSNFSHIIRLTSYGLAVNLESNLGKIK